MATTFTDAKATLDEIAERTRANSKRLAQAKALIAQAASDLAAMPTVYGTFITDLNAAAAADSWPQADSQKAEKDQLVADFQAVKTTADALNTAVGN